MSNTLAEAIKAEAQRIGANPHDLATVMSYETGGTFDLWKKGPTTKWGQHIGLIQMGKPQREKYGYYEGMSAEKAVRASADYLVDHGFKPGMGLLDLYSTINAGGPGLYDRSDEAAGGAAGSVRDKVQNQMEGHKAKAFALLGGEFTPAPHVPYSEADGPANELHVYDDHLAPHAPTLIEVTAQNEAQSAKAYGSFSEQLYDSAAQNWYTAKIARWASEGALDPNDMGWTAPEWEDITKTLPERYHDYVLTGSSADNRHLRLKYAQEMAERDERAAASGVMSSLTADLLAGVADPIMLPFAFLSKGGTAAMSVARTFAGKMLTGAAIGGSANAGLELAAKYGLDDPNTDAAMAFGVGALLGGIAGPLARNPATRHEAQRLTEIGGEAVQTGKVGALATSAQSAPQVLPSGLPVVENRRGSAGAMFNRERRDSFVPEEWGIDNADVDRGFGGRARFDAAGQLTTSANPRARLAGFAIYDEPAGTVGHSVVEASASVRASALERKLLGNLQAVYQPAMREYVSESGATLLNPVSRARKAQEFRVAVEEFTRDPFPPADAHPAVIKAATARQKLYADFAGELERVGLGGELIKGRMYSPKIADHHRIAELDRRIHHQDMEAFFAEAIRRAHGEIDDKLVRKMAKGYWGNIRRAGYGIEDSFAGAIGLGDRDAFKQAFKRAMTDGTDLADDELDKAFDVLSSVVDASAAKRPDGSNGVSRLKRRTVMDYRFAAQVRTRDGGLLELRPDDLFINDSEFLDRRYARSMTGRIAFADTRIRDPKSGELIFDGIRSEGDLERLKSWVRDGYRALPGGYDRHRSAMETAIENIDFGWKRVNGIPVMGQEKAYAQWTRRLKSMQFVRLMSNMGLNQVQESWKVVASTGFRAAASQLPAIGRMVDEAGRSVPRRDTLLAELEHMTGAGLDGLVGNLDLRYADDRIGAATSSKLANGLDVALDWGQRGTAEVSLIRAVQDYQVRWAAKAVSQQLLDMARRVQTEAGDFDLGKLAKMDRARLAQAGIGEEQAQRVFGNMLAHAEVDGSKLVSLGSQNWDPEAVTQFSYTLNRFVDRLVQRNDVGGLHRWMSHPIASMFVQFRSFVFGAWAKSSLYAVNHMDPRMAVLLTGELAFGAATYLVRTAPEAWATDDGWEAFMDEKLDPANVAKQGWARSASASILPMLMDSALMFTPAGAQFGTARASGSPTDAFFGSPAVDQIGSARQFSRGLADATISGREMTQGELKAGWRAFVPLGNFLPVAALYSHLVQDRPTRAPRD